MRLAATATSRIPALAARGACRHATLYSNYLMSCILLSCSLNAMLPEALICMFHAATAYLPGWLLQGVIELPGRCTSGCIFCATSVAGQLRDWLHAQVAVVEHQHRTMIEAVENHMPEALVRPSCFALSITSLCGIYFAELLSCLPRSLRHLR